MPYRATVYRVMVASPGDVSAERRVVADVIHEWNAIHSDDRRMVLMPVRWESHAAPEMGDRPQAVINRQILQDCDLLVAMFWTRLGSPTVPRPVESRSYRGSKLQGRGILRDRRRVSRC
jgi:hypothetical protein